MTNRRNDIRIGDIVIPGDEALIELPCGHEECEVAYAAEIERVGEYTAEALCVIAEPGTPEREHEECHAATGSFAFTCALCREADRREG